MAQLVGDRFLPEQVASARQRVRSRLSELREPIRSRREQLVPGPDIIGRVEDQFSSLRSRFVSRTSLMERIRSQREGEDSDSSGRDTSSPTSEADKLV